MLCFNMRYVCLLAKTLMCRNSETKSVEAEYFADVIPPKYTVKKYAVKKKKIPEGNWGQMINFLISIAFDL